MEPERSWPYSHFNLSQLNPGRTFIDVIISILLFQRTVSCSHYIADCVLPNFSYLNIWPIFSKQNTIIVELENIQTDGDYFPIASINNMACVRSCEAEVPLSPLILDFVIKYDNCPTQDVQLVLINGRNCDCVCVCALGNILSSARNYLFCCPAIYILVFLTMSFLEFSLLLLLFVVSYYYYYYYYLLC